MDCKLVEIMVFGIIHTNNIKTKNYGDQFKYILHRERERQPLKK